jgi:hypothetical protein
MDRELMDTENLITETFTAHEHVVPDSDTVLTAARQRIDRGRTVLSRPVAVAAGVVALTLAAVTVVALNRSGSTPADNAQVGAPGEATGPASTGSTEPAVAGLPMPYSLDWLPPGKVDYVAQRINIGGASNDQEDPLYGGEYMLTVTAGGQVLDVDVQQFRMVSVDEATFKSGPGVPVTIKGQRGVESSVSDGPGGYELYVTRPDGGTMYVNVSAEHGSTATAQQLVGSGRQIAQNIRFPGTTTVTPAFGLRDLPNGLRVCAFDVEKGLAGSSDGSALSTSYELGTCATMPPIHVGVGNTKDDTTGVPGQPVQGHATRYADENGYHRLWVLDAVDGAPVTIAGSVPQADLYDIANRLVLPN